MLLRCVGLPPCAATLRPWATNPDAPGKRCPVVITSALCGYHLVHITEVHITEGTSHLWRLDRAVGGSYSMMTSTDQPFDMRLEEHDCSS
jgi:hypothetical protein